MTLKELDIIEKNLNISLEENMIELNRYLDEYDNVSMEDESLLESWGNKFMDFITQTSKNKAYDVSEKISNTMSQLRRVKLDKLYMIQLGLSNNTIKSNGSSISGKLKGLLSIYSELGYGSSYSDIEEYISLPRDIIVKEGIFPFITNEVATNLITKKDKEVTISKKLLPLDFDSLIRGDIPDFINNDTKIVIPSNLYGKTIFLMKVDQSSKNGTTIHNKKLRIEETDIELPPVEVNELKSLVDQAIKLGLDTSYMEYNHMKKYKIEIDNLLKNRLKNIVLKSPLAIFNYRRLMSGLNRTIIGLKRSHLQSLDIVEYIARIGTNS